MDTAGASHGEDALLVAAFQSGDRAAFDRLVLKHKDRIFNLCCRLLGDREEANDSAQETFVKVYESLDKFRLESTFATWLYRIAVNICKNKSKSLWYRLRRRMVRLGDPEDAENPATSVHVANGSRSPLLQCVRKEEGMLIARAIEALPLEQKTVVVLRHIEGLSYEEIVQITGHNLGTVKSRISRARLHLKETLKEVI